jgi:hypothetical protein
MKKSKKVRVGNCTSQELFIAMCYAKNKLLNKVVKDKDAVFFFAAEMGRLVVGR